MTISRKPNRPVFKEFELIDLFPYGLAVLMTIGYIYMITEFLNNYRHF